MTRAGVARGGCQASGPRFDEEGDMRRVRYSVAMSLDGYVAGPKDEIDWIMMDPDIDFNAGSA